MRYRTHENIEAEFFLHVHVLYRLLLDSSAFRFTRVTFKICWIYQTDPEFYCGPTSVNYTTRSVNNAWIQIINANVWITVDFPPENQLKKQNRYNCWNWIVQTTQSLPHVLTFWNERISQNKIWGVLQKLSSLQCSMK